MHLLLDRHPKTLNRPTCQSWLKLQFLPSKIDKFCHFVGCACECKYQGVHYIMLCLQQYKRVSQKKPGMDRNYIMSSTSCWSGAWKSKNINNKHQTQLLSPLNSMPKCWRPWQPSWMGGSFSSDSKWILFESISTRHGIRLSSPIIREQFSYKPSFSGKFSKQDFRAETRFLVATKSSLVSADKMRHSSSLDR